MESIFVLINFIENENKKKDLLYLVEAHKEAILELDVKLTGIKRDKSKDFKPWLIVKNTTRGIYLINKIMKKFDPWVSLWKQIPVYPHQIPKEIEEIEKWDHNLEKRILKIT